MSGARPTGSNCWQACPQPTSPANFAAPAQVWNWHIAAQGWHCLMSAAGESGQWAGVRPAGYDPEPT
jgi:hypothetical protein